MSHAASFKKEERLRKTSEYQKVFKGGFRTKTGWLGVYWNKCSSGQGKRIGVMIAKRSLKRAVDRNRVKRVVREFFRANKNNLPDGTDIVVKSVSECNRFNSSDLRKEVNELFCKSRLISK
jgi:ribonuclease P protein component